MIILIAICWKLRIFQYNTTKLNSIWKVHLFILLWNILSSDEIFPSFNKKFFEISVNGYLAFATVLDQGPAINVGADATDWPRQQDPAMIAPYLCKQQVPQDGNPGLKSGVFYRLQMRQSMFGRGGNSNLNAAPSQQASNFFGQSATAVSIFDVWK